MLKEIDLSVFQEPSLPVVTEQQRVQDIYNPYNFMKANNTQKYDALIRFVANPENPKQCIKEKFSGWINGFPAGRYIDDVPAVGRIRSKEVPSLFTDVRFGVGERSTSPAVREWINKGSFSSSWKGCCMIQVLKDEHQPQLEGKILSMIFPSAVYKQLKDAEEPTDDLHEQILPFRILENNAYVLRLRIEAGYLNYDWCKFVDKKYYLRDEEGNEIKDGKKEIEYIANHIPSSFKNWGCKHYSQLGVDDRKYIVNYLKTGITNENDMNWLRGTHSELFAGIEDAPIQEAKPADKSFQPATKKEHVLENEIEDEYDFNFED